MKVVAERLSDFWVSPVKMASDVVGEARSRWPLPLKDGEIMLLENTRFEKGETKNDPELARPAGIHGRYVCVRRLRRRAPRPRLRQVLPPICPPSAATLFRRKHGSFIGVRPSSAANPDKNVILLVAILGGGSKVSSKIGVINNLLNIADTIIIGGGMVLYRSRRPGRQGGRQSLLEGRLAKKSNAMMKKAQEDGA